jgi:ribosome biogenesis GTPase / thiamine phosphate phosphatase
MPTGLVMRSTGSRYRVRAEDGALHECVTKGNLRIKGYTSTNPIAVGDRVEFTPQPSAEKVGSVTALHERRNYIIRRSVNLSHHMHVIAANLDQALIIATVARPRTSFGFIDRFLVTGEAYSVPCVVVLNKVDAVGPDERELLEEYIAAYTNAGYRVLCTSAIEGTGVEEFRSLLLGKVTLLAGHSGVGKSTLINALDPALDLRTQEISDASDKGQHTTTFAEMFELEMTGSDRPTFIIDTPGVKGFGLVDMTADEIVDQFPELFRLKGRCRFADCKHINEPGCAVKEALGTGAVATSRYKSYVDMVNGVEDESPYRLD